MLTIRGRWRDGGDRYMDGFRHSRGVASIGGCVFAHFFHDDHGLGDLKSFGLALELIWCIGGRGYGVIFRGSGMFTDVISK